MKYGILLIILYIVTALIIKIIHKVTDGDSKDLNILINPSLVLIKEGIVLVINFILAILTVSYVYFHFDKFSIYLTKMPAFDSSKLGWFLTIVLIIFLLCKLAFSITFFFIMNVLKKHANQSAVEQFVVNDKLSIRKLERLDKGLLEKSEKQMNKNINMTNLLLSSNVVLNMVNLSAMIMITFTLLSDKFNMSLFFTILVTSIILALGPIKNGLQFSNVFIMTGLLIIYSSILPMVLLLLSSILFVSSGLSILYEIPPYKNELRLAISKRINELKQEKENEKNDKVIHKTIVSKNVHDINNTNNNVYDDDEKL